MGRLLLPKGFAPGFGNPRVAPDENLVEIDWNDPITEGLLHYSIGRRDLVTDHIVQPIENWGGTKSGYSHGKRGFALETHANFAAGLFWDRSPGIKRLDGSFDATVVVHQSITSVPTVGSILVIPDIPTGNPNVNVGLQGVITSLKGRFAIRIAAGNASADSIDNFIELSGGPITYAASKNDTDVRFYKDGVLFDTATNANIVKAIALDDDVMTVQLMSSNVGHNKGVTGKCWLSAIWVRDLSAAEQQRMHVDPYSMLRLRVPTLYYFPAAAGGPLNLNRTSSMHFMRHYEPISMGE